jgi:O-antigen ligase
MVLMTKRLIRGAIKTVAGLAALVFFLARMTTNTGLLLFVGSIVVLLVCFGLLRFLEDDDDNTGYWPPNPKT